MFCNHYNRIMIYIEFYKQGNYTNDFNKTSLRDFEQKMYGWT